MLAIALKGDRVMNINSLFVVTRAFWKSIKNWVLVTLTLRLPLPKNHKSIRALMLAVVFAIAFVLFDSSIFKPLQIQAKFPFDLDWALRTVSLGWFEPSHTIPITMVEIDEATFRTWGSKPVTPRDKLVEMLKIVTRGNPAAVVVDIDLSWGDENDLAVLRSFLEGYEGSAPLVFPKRIEPGVGDMRRLAASPLDRIFAENHRLSWAHASFETDRGGTVREWADWLEVCTGNATQLLPSITIRLAAVLAYPSSGMERPKPPPKRGSCSQKSGAPGQILLVGPRLTGPLRHPMAANAQWVGALTLLEPGIELDEAALFGNRVVFIGAAHSGSGDFWLTPSGVLPGVELIANTVRFAPLRTTTGSHAERTLEIAILIVFAMFAALNWWLRGFALVLAAAFSGILFVAAVIYLWDYFRIFEAIETSLLLVVGYKVIQSSLDLVAKCRTEKDGFSRTVQTEHFVEWWEKSKLRSWLTKNCPFGLGRKGRSVRRRT